MYLGSFHSTESRKQERLLPTIKIELFFCLFLRNSALVWSRKISAGWRWTGRARWSKWPGGTFKPSPLCPPGDGPWRGYQGAWGRKGLWGCSEPVPQSIPGNAGDSAILAQGLLLNQGSNSPFPPAPASAAASNTCPDGEGQAWHYSPFPGEEKGGESAKEAFSSPQRGVSNSVISL